MTTTTNNNIVNSKSINLAATNNIQNTNNNNGASFKNKKASDNRRDGSNTSNFDSDINKITSKESSILNYGGIGTTASLNFVPLKSNGVHSVQHQNSQYHNGTQNINT